MGRFLLDTSALINFSRGTEPARSRLLYLIDGDDEVGVCAVSVAECSAGLAPDGRPEWEPFQGALRYWDITRDTVIRAGGYRHASARSGQAISLPDALIAAVAWQERATIVTANARHFPMAEFGLLSLRG